MLNSLGVLSVHPGSRVHAFRVSVCIRYNTSTEIVYYLFYVGSAARRTPVNERALSEFGNS